MCTHEDHDHTCCYSFKYIYKHPPDDERVQFSIHMALLLYGVFYEKILPLLAYFGLFDLNYLNPSKIPDSKELKIKITQESLYK